MKHCFILILFWAFVLIGKAQTRLTPVNDTILTAITQIQVWDSINNKVYTSSAFLLTEKNRFFLVTNKHSIGEYYLKSGLCRIYKKLKISYYSKSDDVNFIDEIVIDLSDENKLFMHPENWVDIVLIEVTEYWNKMKSRTSVCHTNFLIDYEEIKSLYNYDIGDQFLVLGYPEGYSNLKNYLPLCKSVMLSNTIDTDLTIIISEDDKCTGLRSNEVLTGKLLLFDGLIMHGNSGGPVIFKREITTSTRSDGFLKGVNDENRIMGIVSRRVIFGLTIAYSSNYIKEIMKKV